MTINRNPYGARREISVGEGNFNWSTNNLKRAQERNSICAEGNPNKCAERDKSTVMWVVLYPLEIPNYRETNKGMEIIKVYKGFKKNPCFVKEQLLTE